MRSYVRARVRSCASTAPSRNPRVGARPRKDRTKGCSKCRFKKDGCPPMCYPEIRKARAAAMKKAAKSWLAAEPRRSRSLRSRGQALPGSTAAAGRSPHSSSLAPVPAPAPAPASGSRVRSRAVKLVRGVPSPVPTVRRTCRKVPRPGARASVASALHVLHANARKVRACAWQRENWDRASAPAGRARWPSRTGLRGRCGGTGSGGRGGGGGCSGGAAAAAVAAAAVAAAPATAAATAAASAAATAAAASAAAAGHRTTTTTSPTTVAAAAMAEAAATASGNRFDYVSRRRSRRRSWSCATGPTCAPVTYADLMPKAAEDLARLVVPETTRGGGAEP